MQFTTNDILTQRKREIFDEVQRIETQMFELRMELAELEKKREFRIAESDMLDRVEDRSTIYDTKNRQADARDRIMFEDAIREIFTNAGRPLKLKEIVDRLESYGYTWNNYQKARYNVVSLDSVQSAGAFGFYQYLRSL